MLLNQAISRGWYFLRSHHCSLWTCIHIVRWTFFWVIAWGEMVRNGHTVIEASIFNGEGKKSKLTQNFWAENEIIVKPHICMTSISSSLDLLSDLVTFSTMVSCIPEDNITQDKIVPMRRNSVYTILVEVELRHDGQHAQQQLATVGQQQHAHLTLKCKEINQYCVKTIQS